MKDRPMIAFLKPVLLLAWLGFAGLAAASEPLGMHDPLNPQRVFDIARVSGRPILVYFGQPNCEPCIHVEQVLGSREGYVTIAERFHFFNADATQADERPLSWMKRILKLRGTPALAAFSPNGAVLCVTYGDIRDNDELLDITLRIERLNSLRPPATAQPILRSCRGTTSLEEDLIMPVF